MSKIRDRAVMPHGGTTIHVNGHCRTEIFKAALDFGGLQARLLGCLQKDPAGRFLLRRLGMDARLPKRSR